MGIIGVVAALTLPNLNSSTANKEKVVKLQKIYSNLQDAFGRATAVYGPTDEWCTGLTNDACNKRYFERVTEFMKFSKQCTVSDNCSLKFDTGLSAGQSMKYGVILADGATIDIFGALSGWATIMIDLDGFNKGANKHCYDYFKLFYAPSSGLIPKCSYDSGTSISSVSHSDRCTAWILQYGNMDYLKCNDLKFDTKTSCK